MTRKRANKRVREDRVPLEADEVGDLDYYELKEYAKVTKFKIGTTKKEFKYCLERYFAEYAVLRP